MADIVDFKGKTPKKKEPVLIFNAENVEEQLANEACKVRERAYAPYSKFKVGASILSDVGIHTGVNVENASYGCGVCAEASAISAMITSGGKKIRMICISGESKEPVTLCGNCRQKIREFSDKDTNILIVNEKGNLQISSTINQLLPFGFGPENL